MSRSRAIDTRVERMVPAMEEYLVKGIFTKEELRDIAKERLSHEYKLVARPLLFVDVRRAIDFEMELETRIADFLAGSELVKLRRRGDIVARIAHIYEISVPRLGSETEQRVLESQYLQFLRDFNRDNELSRYLAAVLQRSPSNAAAWAFAVEWELAKGNIDNARSIAQEAVKHVASDPRSWVALLRVEINFVAQMARSVLATDKTTKTREKQTQQSGNNNRDESENRSESKNKNANDNNTRGDNNNNNNNANDAPSAVMHHQPLSVRFAALNPPLAKVVVDGELVKAAARAAVRSRALSVELVEQVAALQAEIVNDDATPMVEEFFALFFVDCAQHALSASEKRAGGTHNATSTIALAALTHLLQCTWSYFLPDPALSSSSSSAATATMRRKLRQKQPHQHRKFIGEKVCWNPQLFLDEQSSSSSSSSSSSQQQLRDCTPVICTSELATKTLQAMSSLCRETSAPAIVQATLQFALMLEQQRFLPSLHNIVDIIIAPALVDSTTNTDVARQQQHQQKKNNNNIIIINGNSNNDGEVETDKRCKCEQAFSHCLQLAKSVRERFANKLQQQQQPVFASSRQQFSIAAWIGTQNAKRLRAAGFHITALVPSLVSGVVDSNVATAAAPTSTSTSTSTLPSTYSLPACESTSALSSSITVVELENRVANFFKRCGDAHRTGVEKSTTTQKQDRHRMKTTNQKNDTNNNNNKKEEDGDESVRSELLHALTTWHVQQLQPSRDRRAFSASVLSSYAAAETILSLLLTRAILSDCCGCKTSDEQRRRRRRLRSQQHHTAFRRNRVEESSDEDNHNGSDSSSSSSSDTDNDNDDDDSDDERNNNRKRSSLMASSSSSSPFSFESIVSLFNLMQPTTPLQNKIRSACITVVASVWVELLLQKYIALNSNSVKPVIRDDNAKNDSYDRDVSTVIANEAASRVTFPFRARNYTKIAGSNGNNNITFHSSIINQRRNQKDYDGDDDEYEYDDDDVNNNTNTHHLAMLHEDQGVTHSNDATSASSLISSRSLFDILQLVARDTSKRGAATRAKVRAAIDCCAIVLPQSIDFLVCIASSIEASFAVERKHGTASKNEERTFAENRMRRFFEAALTQHASSSLTSKTKIASSSSSKFSRLKQRNKSQTNGVRVADNERHRETEKRIWQLWKVVETDLGNLKAASDVQRRASSALNDVRLL